VKKLLDLVHDLLLAVAIGALLVWFFWSDSK